MTDSDSVRIDSDSVLDAQILSGCRVLLVEDAPAYHRPLAATLSGAGADVTLECSGQSALERVFRRRGTPEAFDVILMDLEGMPFAGVETIATLRERGFEAPVLFMTSSPSLGDEARCRAAGCDGLLLKPIRCDSLLRAVARCVSERSAEKPSAFTCRQRVDSSTTSSGR